MVSPGLVTRLLGAHEFHVDVEDHGCYYVSNLPVKNGIQNNVNHKDS